MKKFIQISIVLIVAVALVIGLLQNWTGSELPMSGNACRVGWNTRTDHCLALGPGSGAPVKPTVGWNS